MCSPWWGRGRVSFTARSVFHSWLCCFVRRNVSVELGTAQPSLKLFRVASGKFIPLQCFPTAHIFPGTCVSDRGAMMPTGRAGFSVMRSRVGSCGESRSLAGGGYCTSLAWNGQEEACSCLLLREATLPLGRWDQEDVLTCMGRHIRSLAVGAPLLLWTQWILECF